MSQKITVQDGNMEFVVIETEGDVVFDLVEGDINLGTDGLFTGTINLGTRVDVSESTGTLSIFDSTFADSIAMNHDGTDFNIVGTNTTDINITGITTLAAGTVDATFDAITATSFSGPLTGAATQITVADTADATTFLVLVGDAIGDKPPLTDGALTYDAGTGALSATSFVGALTGNADTATALATGRTIGMTGDVAWTSASFDGTGNVAGTSTIQPDAVTMDMIVDVATDTFLGRVTGGTGTVEVLTNAQAKTALDLTGTNSGDEPAASLTVVGVVELATGVETNTGTDATRAVTPDGLDDWTGSAQFTTAGVLTATSYGGITESDLLNRSADETIGGVYTFSDVVITQASDTSAASIRLPHGAAPTSPVDGDIWTTTSSAFVRINGATQDLLAGATPTVITVADETTDTTSFPLFVTAVTGDLGPKTNAGFTFDASTADLNATLIAGIANANLLDKIAAETITAAWTFAGVADVILEDDVEARFGTGNDSRIYFDSSDTFFDLTGASNDFNLRVNATELAITAAPNGAVGLYWDALNKFNTVDHTATDQISGAELLDAEGNMQPAGVGVVITDSTTFDTAATHEPFTQTNATQTIYWVGTGTSNFDTFGNTGNSQTFIPVGTMWYVQSNGSGTLVIRGGTSVTIRYWAGTGAPADADVTVAQGGVATVRKVADNIYDVWGIGLS